MYQNNKLKTVKIAAAPGGKDSLLLECNLVKLGDGSLFVTYTGGGNWEPSNENKTFYSRSNDGGKTWQEEKVLFQHPKKGVFTPELFVNGDRLYAFLCTYFEETLMAQNYDTFFSFSDDYGYTFSPPASLPGGVNSVHIKQATKFGKRWLLSCAWHETDGKNWAPPFGGRPCIVAGQEIAHQQSQVHEWWWSNNSQYCGTLISDDEGESFYLRGKIGIKGKRFVEPVFAQLSNGSLVMLIRSGEPFLYESRSYDLGESWSEPRPTNIPTAVSKTLLLQDKNGTIYMIHNPNSSFFRNPLELWISHDDMESWDEKIVLFSSEDQNDIFTYPDGFIDEENRKICFVWENRKEVFYSEIPIA